MKIRNLPVALCAIISACGTSPTQENNANRISVKAAARHAMVRRATAEQLKQKLEACEAEPGCNVRQTRNELWEMGYCKTASEGPINKCTGQEVADDIRETTAIHNP